MLRRALSFLAAALLGLASPALAQPTLVPVPYNDADNLQHLLPCWQTSTTCAWGVQLQVNGAAITSTNPLPVSSSGGGGGGAVTISPTSSSSAAITPCIGGSGSVACKASAGNLYGAYATSTSSSALWLFIFNATAVPSNGSTTSGTASGDLQDCLPLTANSFVSIGYGPGPMEGFSAGISIVLSSTACGTLTASTAGYIHGSVQ
jgi:hypothetical protein